MYSTTNKTQKAYSDLSADQLKALNRLYEHDATFLVASMGGGKTVLTLTAAQELLRERVLSRVLVVAPLRVARLTWGSEAQAWAHLEPREVTILAGEPPKVRKELLRGRGRVVVINFELLPWLVKQKEFKHFDGLIVDESTKMKSYGAALKALRKHLKHFSWRVAMSGTPVSEGLEQLFYQTLLLDDGQRFGRNRERFMREYFYQTDYLGYSWALKPGAEVLLLAKLTGLMYRLPDYRSALPPLEFETVWVRTGGQAALTYKEMAGRQMTAHLPGERVFTADSAAVQSAKLQQIPNGFMYLDPDDGDGGLEKPVVRFECDKYKRARALLEAAQGPVLVVYRYMEQLAALRAMWPSVRVLGGADGERDDGALLAAWNRGEVPVLALHPRAAGHGLNMQAGGSEVLFLSPVWSHDDWAQVIARLWRRGQARRVRVLTLAAVGTKEQEIEERRNAKGQWDRLLRVRLDADQGAQTTAAV